jgi:hypothetical protein
METNEDYLKYLLPLLKKPIPHSWRVQSYSKNKPVATVMAYIDARDTQEVLDAYCKYGWNRKHEMLNDRLYCSIGVAMPDGTIQWREDCGTESNEDKEKGQASDAFKRAGVNWGIGRFLYDMDIQYVTASDKKEAGKFPHPIDEQGKRIWDMTTYINNKNPDAPKAPTKPPVKEPTTDEKVANMRSNPELPSGISQSILDAKSQADLKIIWENNKDLHTQKKFTDAVTTRKAELIKQGITV